MSQPSNVTVRYSDADLQEFKSLIVSKLEKAKSQYESLKEQLKDPQIPAQLKNLMIKLICKLPFNTPRIIDPITKEQFKKVIMSLLNV